VSIDRAAVLRTIRVYRETVLDVCSTDPEMALRLYADDASALGELLDLACARTGLERAVYEAALLADATLFEVQRLTLREIVAEPPDPGPYAEISRESPAGTPANYHLLPWRQG
jgi:hypothetical protein